MPKLPVKSYNALREAAALLRDVADLHDVSERTTCASCQRDSESHFADYKMKEKCESLATQIEAAIRHYEKR